MKNINRGNLAVLLISFSLSASSASNRENREIKMAEDAIFWSLVASSSERTRNECSVNLFACSDDRAELGLALLGSKLSIEANEALIGLIRYRLDGGIASNFNCFVLVKKSMGRKKMIQIKPPALRKRCVAERERAIKNHPELMKEVDRNAICANVAEIEIKRREFLTFLNKGEVCASTDF